MCRTLGERVRSGGGADETGLHENDADADK
jgi:hypothetical protein